MRILSSRILLSVALGLGAVGAHALTFNITSTGNAQADAGFAQAAAIWSKTYLDPITINIDAGYRNLGNPNTIGQAGSAQVTRSYQAFRTALQADAIYPFNHTDSVTLQNLPNTAGIDWRRRNVATNEVVTDDDGSNNNTLLSINRANAKAVGLLAANDAAIDATIEFNSNFLFDFDRADGIAGNRVDFVGVAFHELGHALGFVSGVDRYDEQRRFNPSADNETALNDSAVFSPLDLLRYSASGVRNVAYGVESYLSINNGGTHGGLGPDSRLSTGFYNGDGRQASHWKDNDLTGIYLGAMDPTLARGQLVQFLPPEGIALDAIGYDVVPEPATFLALGVGAAALASRRRRRKS